MDSVASKVHIVSYNLLSTDLTSPAYHIRCKPEHLSVGYRWRLIKDRLLAFTQNNTIICLQELSHEWISKLLVWFAFNDYTFIYDSEQLGIGIAFPTMYYDLQGVNFIKVHDFIAKNYAPKPPPDQTWRNTLKRMVGWFMKKLCFFKHELTPFELACQRRRRLLQVMLKENGTAQTTPIFSIFNYHMPCLFAKPAVMMYHTRALRELCSLNAIGHPFIICGDFNGTPNSSYMVDFMNNDNFPTLPSLVSSYTRFPETRPQYTISSWTANMQVPFKDVIDYIFVNSNGPMYFKPLASLPIRQDHEEGSTFPNEDEPSDHLPIGASFEFVTNG